MSRVGDGTGRGLAAQVDAAERYVRERAAAPEREPGAYGLYQFGPGPSVQDFPQPVARPDLREHDPLAWMVANVRYKPGWEFELVAGFPSRELPAAWTSRMLRVTMPIMDSLTGEQTKLIHQMPTPPPEMARDLDEAWWRRWLLDRIIGIETHEACEFFQLDGERPFFPDHKVNPYAIVDKTPREPS